MNPLLITTKQAVDPVFMFIFGICLVLLIGITVTMVIFVIRYHRSRAPQPTSNVDGNLWLEIVWTALPAMLVMAMFYYGWSGYLALRNVPKDALPVTVTARMWSWNFTYANGKSSPKLYVPVGKPVQVELISQDVLHGFYIPAFRVKRDVVPGMKNYAWFVATRPGSYDLFCSQYCGVGHSKMITTVEAIPPAEFEAWLKQGNNEADGKAYLEKYGCIGCHSLDGSKKVGPSLQKIWGRQETVTTSGKERSITVDEPYLRQSILDPKADVVTGFPPIMPAFAAVIPAAELNEIIHYLQKDVPAALKPNGAQLAKEKGCLVCHSLDGTHGVGPTFKGLAGSMVSVSVAGADQTSVADDAYLAESIRQPAVKIVKGFPPIMPAFPNLHDEEIAALIEFIKEVK